VMPRILYRKSSAAHVRLAICSPPRAVKTSFLRSQHVQKYYPEFAVDDRDVIVRHQFQRHDRLRLA
jgi:hypothetical protein